MIKFESLNKTINLDKLKKEGKLKIILKYDDINNDYFKNEKITLFQKNNNKFYCTYNLNIYYEKGNNFNINLNRINNNFALEIIFYATKSNNIPEFIEYNNNKFDNFDDFKLNNRKRINFINIDGNRYIYDNLKNLLPGYSYKICHRIDDEKKHNISIHIIRFNLNKISSKYEKIKNYFYDLNNYYVIYRRMSNKIKNFFEQFNAKNKLSHYKYIYNNYVELKKIYNENFLKNYEIKYSFIQHYNEMNINNININILQTYFYLRLFNEFKIKYTTYINIIKEDLKKGYEYFFIINNFQFFLEKIDSINIKNEDEKLKYCFRITRSLIEYIIANKSKTINQNIFCLDFSIENVDLLDNNNPYKFSINFLKKVINSLTENSILYDICMHLILVFLLIY